MPTINQRTILCNSAASNWGKTTFIKQINQLFVTNASRFQLKYKGPGKVDIFYVYQDRQHNNQEIVIVSVGDAISSYNRLKKYLIKNNNVRIVICASRQKREPTWKEINRIAKQFGFDFFAYANFYNKTLSSTSSFNNDMAQMIYNWL